MQPLTLFIAACALSIDAGWQPLANGELEYIIQIEPQMLDTLKTGKDIVSDIPPYLKTVRSYRITVGTGPLPRRTAPVPQARQTENVPATDNEARLPTVAGRPAPRAPVAPEAAAPEPDVEVAPHLNQAEPAATAAAGPANEPTFRSPKRLPQAATEVPSPPAQPPSSLADEPHPPASEPAAAAFQLDEAVVHHSQAAPATENQLAPPITPTALSAGQPSTAPQGTSHPTQSGSSHPVVTANVAKPWWLLTATLLGLFFSVGSNMYLGWVMWGLRAKYRALLNKIPALNGLRDDS